ncbi:hypothetical protein ABIC55_001062 [Sporosarcina psychrophila]|uniref:Uncharacterized protein n=1 Tax=Sporosarcina psychrophila TaxID=1476 RepID=A0ABV2K4G7_SPOPS
MICSLNWSTNIKTRALELYSGALVIFVNKLGRQVVRTGQGLVLTTHFDSLLLDTSRIMYVNKPNNNVMNNE